MTSSRFLGVRVVLAVGSPPRYVAVARHANCGTWPTELEAAVARDRAALSMQHAPILNLPDIALPLGPCTPVELRRLAAVARRAADGRSAYLGVDRRLTGFRAGSYEPWVRVGAKHVRLGCWLDERAAVVARDRAILHFRLDLPLQLPEVSRPLGPASPAQLRTLARRELHEAKGMTSRFVGVFWSRERGKWAVAVRIDGTPRHIGYFEREEDAAIAHDRVMAGLRPGAAPINLAPGSAVPATLAEGRKLAREIGKETRGDASRYRGVLMTGSDARPWQATLNLPAAERRTTLALGTWETEEQAAEAVDRARRHYLPDDEPTKLNFPDRRLAAATAAQLSAEARMVFKRSAYSLFRGVTWSARRNVWIAQIKHGDTHRRSQHDDELAAARAYDLVATELLGELAKLNFHPATGVPLHGQRVAGPAVARQTQTTSLRSKDRERARGRPRRSIPPPT